MNNIFSIIIPSWNNLPYLKKCIASIQNNSHISHEIVVHVNEGTDGTVEWLSAQAIEFTYSEENIGICKAVNKAFTKTTKDIIIYMNDDMYVLPKWDEALSQAANEMKGAEHFMISATMIEPADTGNPVVIHADYGKDLESFREKDLLNADLKKGNWSGASWPPVLIPRHSWEVVGGFSEEFSPGMYSDPDLSMKLWEIGCRHYKGVGDALVYHFQQRSTGRIKKNPGKKQFLKKWGITPGMFYSYYLKMGKPYHGMLSEPRRNLRYFLSYMKARAKKLFLK